MDGSDAMMEEEISAEALGDIKCYQIYIELMLERLPCKIGFCIPQSVVPLLENSVHFCSNIQTKLANPYTAHESIISANATLRASKWITVISVARVPQSLNSLLNVPLKSSRYF